MPITSLQKFLGHQDINKTLIYARVFDETVRDQFATAMAQAEAIAGTDSLTGLFKSLNHRYPFRPRLDTRCNAQNLSGRSFCRDILDRRAPAALVLDLARENLGLPLHRLLQELPKETFQVSSPLDK